MLYDCIDITCVEPGGVANVEREGGLRRRGMSETDNQRVGAHRDGRVVRYTGSVHRLVSLFVPSLFYSRVTCLHYPS